MTQFYPENTNVYSYTNKAPVCFKSFSLITQIEALIYFMEGNNIHPDYSRSSSFDDLDVDDLLWYTPNGHIRTGSSIFKMATSSTDFLKI